MNSKGHVMTVPMPGHPVNADAAGELQLKELERLVEEHDVIFLLTDSRESRWLPTLLGAVKGKVKKQTKK